MFLHSVIQTIRRRNLLAPGQHVLVAVSGGADSVALLAVLREMAPAWQLRLTVAHLNHGIRGPAAAGDARFVKALARRLKLPFAGGRADVSALASRQGLSLEMAGRLARYSFFAAVARRQRCDVVATAHTADDQAETVLLNLARGAGAAGLAGIPFVARRGALKIIRPLRDVDRKSVERFLAARRLAWREDATNSDPAFLRNRVRHEVIPFLEKRLNPGVRPALVRAGEILAGENEWLDGLVAEIMQNCRLPVGGHVLDARRLAGYPVAARRRLLRRWLEERGLDPETSGFDAIARLDNLVTNRRGGRAATLAGGWLARRDGDALELSTGRNGNLKAGRAPASRPGGAQEAARPAFADGSARSFSVRLVVPGQVRVPARRIRIVASIGPGIVKGRPAAIGALPARASLSLRAWRRRRLVARAWQPGDRMRPLGMRGTKKLQDIFSDSKVPAAVRHGVAIIECGGEIVWIPGYRIARGWEVRPDERSALQLSIKR